MGTIKNFGDKQKVIEAKEEVNAIYKLAQTLKEMENAVPFERFLFVGINKEGGIVLQAYNNTYLETLGLLALTQSQILIQMEEGMSE